MPCSTFSVIILEFERKNKMVIIFTVFQHYYLWQSEYLKWEWMNQCLIRDRNETELKIILHSEPVLTIQESFPTHFFICTLLNLNTSTQSQSFTAFCQWYYCSINYSSIIDIVLPIQLKLTSSLLLSYCNHGMFHSRN